MLGLDWTELALIAVVAVVVIGPKDLPEAVRGVAKGIQKLRRMAGEFQGQVDEVVREAKLDDVRNQINEIRNFDFKSVVEKEIDKDGDLRKTFTEDPIGNPLKDAFSTTSTSGATVTPPPPPPPPAAPAMNRKGEAIRNGMIAFFSLRYRPGAMNSHSCVAHIGKEKKVAPKKATFR